MPEAIQPKPKPKGYAPPTYAKVEELASIIRLQRKTVINRIWDVKRARRGQWNEVLKSIPAAYRKVTPPIDHPEVREMLQRVSGIIQNQTMNVEVNPASPRTPDVSKAAKEEARLMAAREDIQDQQDRDTFAMGIDAQCAWGESWIMVMPDPKAFGWDEESGDDPYDFGRKEGEAPKDYVRRYGEQMAEGCLPITFTDFDPQMVLPFRADNERLVIAIIESVHVPMDIELGLGYTPVKNKDSKIIDWTRSGSTLSEPFVAGNYHLNGMTTDVDHANTTVTGANGETPPPNGIRKTIFLDAWTYQCYLDGILVEEWSHNFGIVPLFPADGETSSDRDPAWRNKSVVEAPLAIAKQIIYYSAILASSAQMHGWPTPFLKGEESLVAQFGRPLNRQIIMGELNKLGPDEEISFPFLDAKMMPDFFKHMEMLTDQLANSGISNFNSAIESGAAGYAVAQVRSMQLAILRPIYESAARQWRKIFYFIRYLVREIFPAGIFLRGAIETQQAEGAEIKYRPILEYAKEDTTKFSIGVHISEGIVQDEMAERKSAIEMVQAGLWSSERAMEKTGVQDPVLEQQKITQHRLLNSPQADQQILTMAMAIAAQRYQAMNKAEQSSVFMQQLAQAQQSLLGAGQGNFDNQGTSPQNALPGGQPMQQNPSPSAPPQPGGPASGPPVGGSGGLEGLGVPGLPGGVAGNSPQQMPSGAPG